LSGFGVGLWNHYLTHERDFCELQLAESSNVLILAVKPQVGIAQFPGLSPALIVDVLQYAVVIELFISLCL